MSKLCLCAPAGAPVETTDAAMTYAPVTGTNTINTTIATALDMFNYRHIIAHRHNNTPTADRTTENDKKWCGGFRSQLLLHAARPLIS